MAWTCIDCGTRYPTRASWCSSCASIGRVMLLGDRPHAEIDLVPETSDAASLARLAGEPSPLPGYPAVMVGHGALAVLWGVPAGGKSTLAASILDATRGPVLYVSCEEGLGPTLAHRLKRLGVTRRDYHLMGRGTVDQVAAEIRRRQAVAVCIDSVQSSTWEPHDLRHMLALTPRLGLLVAVCQVNAKGAPEGRRSLIHEADLALHVEALHYTVTKSRYQEITDGKIALPVLHGPLARNEIRREISPVSHLRIVQREDLPEGDREHRGAGADQPPDRGTAVSDLDRPQRVGEVAGDMPTGRGVDAAIDEASPA